MQNNKISRSYVTLYRTLSRVLENKSGFLYFVSDLAQTLLHNFDEAKPIYYSLTRIEPTEESIKISDNSLTVTDEFGQEHPLDLNVTIHNRKGLLTRIHNFEEPNILQVLGFYHQSQRNVHVYLSFFKGGEERVYKLEAWTDRIAYYQEHQA
ncbi:hypothetical protein [Candidatus Odyssella thessalonicensis]|uniref:hypothetical protein n=1 Tax=Candidatus Odyssella thessalonicensis TaxID=84647 RepID=UPI000225B505|nr:hypothetical protein [Candidatus Odyssella thessalonicensis]